MVEKLCIYPKDIVLLLGVSRNTAYKKLQLIKAALGKRKHQVVTLNEFAAYFGISQDEISQKIKS